MGSQTPSEAAELAAARDAKTALEAQHSQVVAELTAVKAARDSLEEVHSSTAAGLKAVRAAHCALEAQHARTTAELAATRAAQTEAETKFEAARLEMRSSKEDLTIALEFWKEYLFLNRTRHARQAVMSIQRCRDAVKQIGDRNTGNSQIFPTTTNRANQVT